VGDEVVPKFALTKLERKKREKGETGANAPSRFLKS
jgi:hypothetical protein